MNNVLFLTHNFSKWLLCPGHDVVDPVLPLLLTHTNACCNLIFHPFLALQGAAAAHWVCWKCRWLQYSSNYHITASHSSKNQVDQIEFIYTVT